MVKHKSTAFPTAKDMQCSQAGQGDPGSTSSRNLQEPTQIPGHIHWGDRLHNMSMHKGAPARPPPLSSRITIGGRTLTQLRTSDDNITCPITQQNHMQVIKINYSITSTEMGLPNKPSLEKHHPYGAERAPQLYTTH
jgi:hypothetical protein